MSKKYTYMLEDKQFYPYQKAKFDIDIDPDGTGRVISLDYIRIIADDVRLPDDRRILTMRREADKRISPMQLTIDKKLSVKKRKDETPFVITKENGIYSLYLSAAELKKNGYEIHYDVKKQSFPLGFWTISASVTHPEMPEFLIECSAFSCKEYNELSSLKDALSKAATDFYPDENAIEKLEAMEEIVRSLKTAVAKIAEETPDEMKKLWGIHT